MKKLATLTILAAALSMNLSLASQSDESISKESEKSFEVASPVDTQESPEGMYEHDHRRPGIGIGVRIPGGISIGVRPGRRYPGRPYPVPVPYPVYPAPVYPAPVYPGPTYPAPGVNRLICSAADDRGNHYESSGPYSEDYLRREAYEQCLRSSGYRCHDTGCYMP